jgi:hypothetical protein
MTMIDDDQLASLLTRAAEDFEVPTTGPDEIVWRARTIGAGRTAPEDPTGLALEEGETGAEGTEADGDAGAPTRWREGRLRRAGAAARHHRVFAVAACIVLLLVAVGIGAALGRSSPGPTATSSLRAVRDTTPPRTGSPSSTTVPPSFGVTHAPTAQPENAAAGAAKSTAGQPSLTVPSTTVPGPASLPTGAVGQSAKIEQTGSLGLTVHRGALSSTMTKLSAIATGAGGFVASSQTQTGSGSGGPPSGTITLQVPVTGFAGVLTQAEALGKTSNLTTKATDVTGQYVDLQARIDALSTTRQQYLTIMTKASTIGDILSVQEELDSVQSQIEQLQGQLQLLDSQTAYSTMTITVSEANAPPKAAPVPESGVVRSWHDSISGFGDGVEGIIRYAGPVLFALICLALIWLGGRTLWRRYQRHNL